MDYLIMAILQFYFFTGQGIVFGHFISAIHHPAEAQAAIIRRGMKLFLTWGLFVVAYSVTAIYYLFFKKSLKNYNRFFRIVFRRSHLF